MDGVHLSCLAGPHEMAVNGWVGGSGGTRPSSSRGGGGWGLGGTRCTEKESACEGREMKEPVMNRWE